MNPIKILVNVPLETALAAGRSLHGDAQVTLTDADLAAFTPAIRSLLAPMRERGEILGLGVRDDGGSLVRVLTVDVADAAHVIAALEQLTIARDAERIVRANEREARILKALAAPAEAWFRNDGGAPFWYSRPGAPNAVADSDSGAVHHAPRLTDSPLYLDDEQKKDPRILARRAQLERDALPPLAAAHAEKVSEWRVACEARTQRELAARAAYDEAIRMLAEEESDLRRASLDGYDVEGKVLDRLAEHLQGAIRGPTDLHVTVDRTAWSPDRLPDRNAPNEEAFVMFDRVTRFAQAANAMLPAAIGQWKVSRIVRVDTCPHSGEFHYVTAVCATLITSSSPARERELVVSVEDQACACDVVSDD